VRSGLYYWIERKFNGILLVAVILFAIVSRMLVGPLRSLAPVFFFIGALVLLRIYLRMVKVRPIKPRVWLELICVTLFYAVLVTVSMLQ
jgi:hypothetical protein